MTDPLRHEDRSEDFWDGARCEARLREEKIPHQHRDLVGFVSALAEHQPEIESAVIAAKALRVSTAKNAYRWRLCLYVLTGRDAWRSPTPGRFRRLLTWLASPVYSPVALLGTSVIVGLGSTAITRGAS